MIGMVWQRDAESVRMAGAHLQVRSIDSSRFSQDLPSGHLAMLICFSSKSQESFRGSQR